MTHVWKDGQEGIASHLTQLGAVTRELCLKAWPSPGPGPDLPRTEHAVAAKGHRNELCGPRSVPGLGGGVSPGHQRLLGGSFSPIPLPLS